MKTVVIGGHTRNIGKTSVMAGLIRGLASLGWTAVKITQYGHGVCSLDGEPCECAPKEHAYVLREERNPQGKGDTCRFLAAGARRALWLRVRQGQLAEALPELWQALGRDEHVVIESNSILEFLRPALYLVVLDPAKRDSDFKSSARRFLALADAFIPVGSHLETRAWAEINPQAFGGRPVFPVSSRTYASPELLAFVREKLVPSPLVPAGPQEPGGV